MKSRLICVNDSGHGALTVPSVFFRQIKINYTPQVFS